MRKWNGVISNDHFHRLIFLQTHRRDCECESPFARTASRVTFLRQCSNERACATCFSRRARKVIPCPPCVSCIHQTSWSLAPAGGMSLVENWEEIVRLRILRCWRGGSESKRTNFANVRNTRHRLHRAFLDCACAPVWIVHFFCARHSASSHLKAWDRLDHQHTPERRDHCGRPSMSSLSKHWKFPPYNGIRRRRNSSGIPRPCAT